MATCIQQLFTAQALHLRYGRIEQMVRPYAVPLPVALPASGFVVLPSRERVAEAFRMKFAGLKAAGIGYLRAAVTQTLSEADGRAKASVDWFYIGQSGERLGRTSAIYFIARENGALSVQMIEFERLAFPAISDWFQESGRSDRSTRMQRFLH